MADTNFYTYRDGSKCELCKSCLTMHINTYEEDTFLWAIEKFDVPYVPTEWKKTREKEFEKALVKVQASGAKDAQTAAYNMTKGNNVVFGKYLSKMKTKQWLKWHWADSDALRVKMEEEAKLYGTPDEVMKEKIENMKIAYENGEISEAQYMTYMDINAPIKAPMSQEEEFLLGGGPSNMKVVQGEDLYPVNEHPFEVINIPDVGNDLTEEDKVYLAMKWGRLYSAADWVTLEQMYNEYDKSFDLHNADLIAGTKQLCKLDLKGNQALDAGDFDSYAKIARASDSLRKSLKFTEAQRKDEKGSSLSCYGQIVAYCEKTTGYIPKIDLTVDRDIADEDLRNIKEYNQQLIKDDPAVYKQIENYIKKREILAEQEADITAGIDELSDEDFAKFQESIESQKDYDEEDEV